MKQTELYQMLAFLLRYPNEEFRQNKQFGKLEKLSYQLKAFMAYFLMF